MASKKKYKMLPQSSKECLTHFFPGPCSNKRPRESIQAADSTQVGGISMVSSRASHTPEHELQENAKKNLIGTSMDLLTSKEVSSSSGKGTSAKEVSSSSGVGTSAKEVEDNEKSSKRRKGEWDLGRTFQADWVSKYPFIQPLKSSAVEASNAAKCTVCSWKMRRDVVMQLKLDTIEKHIGKVYEEDVVDGVAMRIVCWKTSEECRHVKNMALYEIHLQQLQQNKQAGECIQRLYEKKILKDGQSTLVQYVIVLHILSIGKPMADYPRWRLPLSFIGLRCPSFPTQYWNEPSGWEFARFMAEVVKGDLRQRISEATYLAISLDEVTARDGTSWACINVYYVVNHTRKVMYAGIFKLKSTETSNILVELVIDCLTTIGGMTLESICKKIICVGVDGCSVMHGNRAGLCVQLQTSFCPYMLGIHCMAHRTNLAYKILKEFNVVQKVEDLVHKCYKFFSKSPKRQNHFTMFAEGISEGKKMLKHIDTRWISLIGPVERLFDEYKSVVGIVFELSSKKGKGEVKEKQLLELLSDVETFLFLGGLIPMLRQMNLLVKIAQMRECYIMEYTTARRMACLRLSSLYNAFTDFLAKEFNEWRSSFDTESEECFLKYDDKGHLCIKVKDIMVRLHVVRTVKKQQKFRNVTKSNFQQVVSHVKSELVSICDPLTHEIRDRFPKDDLLDAMAIVHPLYWNNTQNKKNLLADFSSRLSSISEHFGKTVKLHGKPVDGIISSKQLIQQSALFGETMWQQYKFVEEPSKPRAMLRLWEKLSLSAYLRDGMSEYFKLADLCQTMILGSVEDERVFSSLTFIRNQLQNKLGKNLDTCLRLFTEKPNLETFPYEEAYLMWESACQRRGMASASSTIADTISL